MCVEKSLIRVDKENPFLLRNLCLAAQTPLKESLPS
jgi:hypothetical protein